MKNKLSILKNLLVCSFLLGITCLFNVLHAQNGTLDNSFGTNGITVLDLNAQLEGAFIEDIVVLDDDQILVIGTLREDQKDVFVAKFTADGILDPTFGNQGISSIDPSIGGYDNGIGIDVQSDGKILYSGHSIVGNLHVLLGRLDADGQADATFNGGSAILISPNNSDYGYNVAVDNSGKILVSGTSVIANQATWAIYRFNSNGSPDVNFGNAGVKIVTVVNNAVGEETSRLTVGADNSVYMVGYNNEQMARGLICKLTPTGQFDNSFAGDGTQSLQIPNSAINFNDVTVDNDGTVWIAGTETTDNGKIAAIFKVNSNGQFDNTFGQNGKVSLPSQSDPESNGHSIHRNNNQVILSGNYYNGTDYLAFTAVYNTSGILNTSYGLQGVSLIQPINQEGGVYNCIVKTQSSDKIIIAGHNYINTDSKYTPWIARLSNDLFMDVEEISSEVEMSVYPNPATSYFQIHTTKKSNIEQVDLINMAGKIVATWNGNQSMFQLPQNLSNGTYMVSVKTGNIISKQILVINQ